MTRFDHTWDEEAGPLVRPYTLTRGRTRPADDLTLITLITAVDPDPAADGRGEAAHPEHADILRLCRRPHAVAEVAALIGLPVSVVKILVGDLLAAGRVTARAPLSMARKPNAELLRKVRDGLGRL